MASAIECEGDLGFLGLPVVEVEPGHLRVVGWTDSGDAEFFRDEYGDIWQVTIDAADGTLATEHAGRPECAIACWIPGSSDLLTIERCPEGSTYGVNCTDEWIAHRGEWIENDGTH